jgi:hypothetical protein
MRTPQGYVVQQPHTHLLLLCIPCFLPFLPAMLQAGKNLKGFSVQGRIEVLEVV